LALMMALVLSATSPGWASEKFEDFMFAADLERDYKLPQSTWRHWHHTGQLRAAKVGRRLVWKRGDAIAFLAEQGLDVTA
jgi:hypothetical protein